MTVALIVIMMPGIYAFEIIVRFNRGKMLDALQASASCFFVIGAPAMGWQKHHFSADDSIAICYSDRRSGMSAAGPSQHTAPAHDSGHKLDEADIDCAALTVPD